MKLSTYLCFASTDSHYIMPVMIIDAILQKDDKNYPTQIKFCLKNTFISDSHYSQTNEHNMK